LIASCDCIIAPSISEWFWSVHTEAVAMWKILITTNTSAIPEVVWGNVNFIKPENSNDIYLAVKQVIDWTYKKIPNKTFNWDDTVWKIEELY
jgi:glycosyltransferase involved in cell wall biosynthesis